MSTHETALPEAKSEEPQSELVRNFLHLSAAYLFSCAYRDNLRAAFARRAVQDPVLEHALRYRELLASETADLMRTQWDEMACTFATANSVGENVRPAAG